MLHSVIHLTCFAPVLQVVMQDPVLCADGITYERAAIKAWLDGNVTSPVTSALLSNKELIPNYTLRSILATMVRPQSTV